MGREQALLKAQEAVEVLKRVVAERKMAAARAAAKLQKEADAHKHRDVSRAKYKTNLKNAEESVTYNLEKLREKTAHVATIRERQETARQRVIDAKEHKNEANHETKSVAHNILKYGAYNRPNFYVRLLNGRAEPPGQDSKMGPGELQSALSVVAHIDFVFLLEGDLQPKVRRAMLGRDVDMPHVSNSFFSARAVASYPERLKQMPPTDHYKPKFLEANCADLSFYYALVNKLRAEKLCKGCATPPHRFFRGSEAHPRPRCFNVADVKPHPSL